MPSLRNCLDKFGKALDPKEVEGLMRSWKQNKADGYDPDKAGHLAVETAQNTAKEHLSAVNAQIVQPKVESAAQEPAPVDSKIETQSQVVVTESKAAAVAESATAEPKTFKETQADLLAKIDAAIPKANGEGTVSIESGTTKYSVPNNEKALTTLRNRVKARISGPIDAAPFEGSHSLTLEEIQEIKSGKIDITTPKGRSILDRATPAQLVKLGLNKKYTKVAPGAVMPTKGAEALTKLKAGEEAKGTFPASLTPESPRGMPLDEARSVVSQFQKDNQKAPKIFVVDQPELTVNGLGVRGAYKDGVLTVNAAHAPDAATLHSIIRHEWAHETLSSKQGRVALTSFAQREIPAEQMGKLAEKYTRNEGESVVDHRTRLVEEWVAANAEKESGVFKRIVEAVRGWLARKGIVNLTHEEAANAMLHSLRKGELTKGEPTGSTKYNLASQAKAAVKDPGKWLNESKERIVEEVKKGDVEKALTYTRDAVDNKAMAYGNERAHTISTSLERAFGKATFGEKLASQFGKESTLDKAHDALAFAVESGSDAKALDVFAQKISSSTKADPEWKARALEAIAFAKDNLAKLEPIVAEYNAMTKEQLRAERASGKDTLEYPNYVMHAQDVDTSLGHAFMGGSGGDSTSFNKIREHPTFADSISAGVDPKSLDAVDLLQSRLQRGQQSIFRDAWTEGLKSYKDPVSKQQIATDAELKTRQDGSAYFDAPNGYTVERVGNKHIAVMKGYEGIFNALTDPSWWSKSAARRGIQQANAVGKSVALMMDTFHLGRLAAWNGAVRANAGGLLGGGAEAPKFWSHKEGVTLLDSTMPEIIRQAKADGLDAKKTQELLQAKKELNLAIDTGANFGRVADAMHEDIIHQVPIVGGFNKWLFGQFQRGAMAEIWRMEFARQKKMFSDLTEREVARKVSEEVNTRFGNLGRQGWFKSRTAQDMVRLIALAPQWNEGLIRSEVGAVGQAGKTAYDLATKQKLQSGMLLRSVATMVLGQFAANQLINQYTRGQFTWDNKEEGIGAKLSAWIPDKVGGGSGFFLHPMGIGAEITHLLTSKYEKTGDALGTAGAFARSRTSAIGRPIATAALGTNSMGMKIRPGDIWKEVGKESVPLPIPTGSIVGAARTIASGEKTEKFPGQFQKQMMSTFGVKTDQAPSNLQRIKSLAHEFNSKNGVPETGELYVKDYGDLDNALRTGNKAEADASINELIATKSPKQIAERYARMVNLDFTGKKEREAKFIRSLSQDQKIVLIRAKQERIKMKQDAFKALKKYLNQKRPEGYRDALTLMNTHR